MGLFDSLKSTLTSELKQAAKTTTNKAVNNLTNSVKNSVKKAVNTKSVKFKFNELPTTLAELKALPEAKLDTPFKTVALTMAALCNYGNNPEATYEMLDFLEGPDDVNEREKQFLGDRLDGKLYKTFAFFEGATSKNGYTPTKPYTITVTDNEYSYSNENWATLYVKSAGADSEKPVVLRKKPSTGEWFVTDIQCLTDIRIPEAQDPWA